MLVQAYLGAERFVAQLARERPLAVVRPPGMHFQAVRRREHFVALDARVHVAEHRAPHQHVMVAHRVRGRHGGERLVGARSELLSQLHHVFGRRMGRAGAGRLLGRRVERIRRRRHTCRGETQCLRVTCASNHRTHARRTVRNRPAVRLDEQKRKTPKTFLFRNLRNVRVLANNVEQIPVRLGVENCWVFVKGEGWDTICGLID